MINKSFSKGDMIDIIREFNLDIPNNNNMDKIQLSVKLWAYINNMKELETESEIYNLKTKEELLNYLSNHNPDKLLSVKEKTKLMNFCKEVIVYCTNGYNIEYSSFKIPIPPKRVKQTEEQKAVKKKQDLEKIKEERRKEKPFLPYKKLFGELQRKYNAETKRNNYSNVEEVIKKMKEQLEEKFEEIVEDADEKDIEIDDDLYDDIESDIANYYTKLRKKAKEQEDK